MSSNCRNLSMLVFLINKIKTVSLSFHMMQFNLKITDFMFSISLSNITTWYNFYIVNLFKITFTVKSENCFCTKDAPSVNFQFWFFSWYFEVKGQFLIISLLNAIYKTKLFKIKVKIGRFNLKKIVSRARLCCIC